MSSHPNSMFSGPSQKGVFPKWLCSVGSKQYAVGSIFFCLLPTTYRLLILCGMRPKA